MTDPRDEQGTDAAAAASVPLTPGPRVEPPSPDVEAIATDTALPGAHRGGFARLPTAPVDISLAIGPSLDDEERDLRWAPIPAPPRRTIAGWALAFGIIGLVVSLFVGWGFLFGIIAVVAGIVAVRRPLESTGTSAWAIALGAVSVLYSIGWLVYAGVQTGVLG